MASLIVIGPLVACTRNVGVSLNHAHGFTAACTGIDPYGADQTGADFFLGADVNVSEVSERL